MSIPRPPTPASARIRWEEGQWGNLVGYVGTLEPWAFQIWHISDSRHWSPITSFPGEQASISTSADPERLKGRAEDWLAGFVTSLGAIFPAEPIGDDQRWQVREARDLLARWDRDRFSEDGYSAERTLADHLRAMLAIVDHLAPQANPAPAGEKE